MGWISVKERLPKNGQSVLGWDTEHEYLVVCEYHRNRRNIYGDDKSGFHEVMSGHHLPLVTHWMELPAPPEEE